MSDIKRLLAIMNENTVAGGVATVAAPMGEMQKRVEETQEESAKAPEVIEYGMWENSALATTSKLKKNRDKSAKVVKSIYGEDVQSEAKKIPASNKPVDPKDLVVSLKDVPTKKPRGHKQYDPAKEFPGVKAFQKEGVAEGKFVKAAGGVPSDRHGNPLPPKPPKSVSTMTLKQLEKNKRENPGQSPFVTQDEKVKKYLGLEEEGVAEGSEKKDMTGQTCEKCKKDKYKERSWNDDRNGTLQCSCGHVVDRWRKYKKKDEKQGVAEGGILKSIKRGLQGWDQNAVGPSGEKLGDPRAIVQRAKEMDTNTAKKVRAGLDAASDHSPAGLQKRVLDRKLKGVVEGSEWETRHDEFTTVGDRATPEQINKIVSALGVAVKQASGKRGFLNQIVGKQSNGDLARMAHGAETLAKNIQKNRNAKPGTDERKELGQHLVYAVSLLKKMSGKQGVAEGSEEKDPVWNKGTPMPKDYTCHCGLYVHPSRRNPKAIHASDCPYAKKQDKEQGVAEGYNLDSHIKQTRDRILKYKDWNTTGSHDKKIKELQDKLKELLAQKKQGVAEGSEDRKTAPGWHSDSVKNPNFNDELSGRRVSPPGERLKSGKLSADERGSQERTKALMKFKKAQGGLTGPKGVLPEQGVAESISIKSTDDNYNIVNSKGEVIKQFHKTPKGLEYAKQFLKQNKGNTGLDENTVAEGTLEESDLILNPAGISKRVRDLVSKEADRTDHEVEMAKNDLYQCGKNASQIFKMIRNVSEEEGLEGWVQEKIIKAADYLNTVREYLEGKMMESADGVAQSTKMFTSEGEMKCSECGGVAYEDEKLAEEKDACYSKVKSRYKVWPSAYASGALVKCRKVGAKNWGNKSKK